MTTVGETVTPSPSTATKRVKSPFGGGVFTPNASVTGSTYSALLAIEVVVFVGLWLLMPAIIPSPLRILGTLTDLVTTQGLLAELFTSLTLNIQAILLSTVIALTVSYAAAIPACRPIAQAISKGRFLSLIGLSFIAALYVGGGHPLKLALLTFGLTVFMVTTMVDVVLQVPQEQLDYVRTLRAGEWRVLYEARIRGTLGAAFDMVRQNAAMGWLMLTMVEGMVRGEGGIGRMLIDSEKHFSLAAIFAIQLVFLLVGIGQDMVIVWLKGVLAPYSTLSYNRNK